MKYTIPQFGGIEVWDSIPKAAPEAAWMRWVSDGHARFLVPGHYLVPRPRPEPMLVGTVIRVGALVFVRLIDGALPVMAWGRIGASRTFDWDEVVAAIGDHEPEIWEPTQ